MRGEKQIPDFILYHAPHLPLAVIESKQNKFNVDTGLNQALRYSDVDNGGLEIPFVYATNGDNFVEIDRFTGEQRIFPLDQFPSPAALWQRYKEAKQLTDEQAKLLETPFYDDGRKPRYYQQIAVNRVFENVVKNQNRLLLVMATGTGKTYMASQIIYRLRKAGLKKRFLFLVDRNTLADQTIRDDFKIFRSVLTKVSDRIVEQEYEVYIALYQAVDGKERIENEIQDTEVENLPFSLKSEEIKATSKLLGLTEILKAGIESFGYELNLIFENLPQELKQIEQNFANETKENIYKLQAHIYSVLTKSTITIVDIKYLENIIFKILDYVIKTWCEHEYRESLIELLEIEQKSEENKADIKEYNPPKRDGKETITSLSREQTFMLFQYLQKSKVILDGSFMYDTILAGYIHKMTGFSENTITRKSKNYKEDLQITQAKIKDILALITKDLNEK